MLREGYGRNGAVLSLRILPLNCDQNYRVFSEKGLAFRGMRELTAGFGV
jgi:hypothetical protein